VSASTALLTVDGFAGTLKTGLSAQDASAQAVQVRGDNVGQSLALVRLHLPLNAQNTEIHA